MKKVLKNAYFICFLTFLLTFITYTIIFATKGVYPFGKNSMMIIDSIHQYIPFYALLQNVLKNHGSLFYSFTGGLGFNFWTTIAYYLSCPLNLILAIIPQDSIFEFMDYFIIIKMAFASFCMTYVLLKKNNKSKLLAIAFGFSYGMSNYFLGYFFNIMWLDTVAIFPIVVYGLDLLIKEKKWKTYLFSLLWAIWCNYYIGFIVCIFSACYFLLDFIFERTDFKVKSKKAIIFAITSVLAGGTSAVLILPTYFGLEQSYSSVGSGTPKFVFFQNLFDAIDNHIIFTDSVNVYDNQRGLNIFCGIILVQLLIMFFINKNNSIKSKIKNLILFALLYLGFTNRFINYIWHGFHVQNGIPNRHAFVYICMLILIGYEVSCNINLYRIREILISALLPIIYVFIRKFCFDVNFSMTQIVTTVVFIVIYSTLLILYKKFEKKLFVIVLSIIILIELIINSVYQLKNTSTPERDFYLEDRTSYQKMIDQYTNEDEFFRSEIDRQHMRDAVIFSGGNSVVLFNSTMQNSVVELFDKLGIESRTNKTGYYGFTRLTNDIFGIKYIASPNKISNTFYGYPAVAEYGPFTLYRNRKALPIGFVVSKDIKDWNVNEGNPFEVQNSFVSKALGEESELFIYMYKIEAEDGVKNTVMDEEESQTYFLLEYDVDTLEIETPEYKKTLHNYNDIIIPCNGNSEDWSSSFTIKNDDGSAIRNVFVYKASEEQYEDINEKLSKEKMQNIIVKGNSLSGEVTSENGGELLLTIPYTPEWNIKLDGKKIDADLIGDCLIGIDMPKGIHQISMVYTPKGFYLGLIISIASVAGIIILLFFGQLPHHLGYALKWGLAYNSSISCWLAQLISLSLEGLERETTSDAKTGFPVFVSDYPHLDMNYVTGDVYGPPYTQGTMGFFTRPMQLRVYIKHL